MLETVSPPQSLPGSSIASPRGVKRVRSGDKDAADAGASFGKLSFG